MLSSLPYFLPENQKNKTDLRHFIGKYPNIKFVSLWGIDFLGNDVDERIPVGYFLRNIDDIFAGGVQTDGSSVNLPGIATVNDAQIDFIVDAEAKWFIDYSLDENIFGPEPIGTIRIPVFFKHHDKFYCSRSVLRNSLGYAREEILGLLQDYPSILKKLKITYADISDVYFTTGTELEFWVRTTMDKVSREALTLSQELKESYWKRTKGEVRKSLEESLIMLEHYGIEPEMGHKEVGGVKGKISRDGRLYEVMEQLEIDWQYTDPLQAADNEIFVRYLIKEVFRKNGLDVIFFAKPVEGVAGSGEHVHVGMGLILKDNRRVNLFAPVDRKSFLSEFGFGALMGILKNWPVINPFVTNSHSAIKRLQPGFEAPVSTVASLGRSPQSPSRNRTVLVGLVRSENPLSVRFEVRAPNPHTNTYLAVTAFYLGMLDGMRHAAGRDQSVLYREITKKCGDKTGYLQEDRQYISEENIFDHYTQAEREKLFGPTPKTVWEVIGVLKNPVPIYENTPVTPEIINSYYLGSLHKWLIEITEKEFVSIKNDISNMYRFPDRENELDRSNWSAVQEIVDQIARDDIGRLSLMSQIERAIAAKDYPQVSEIFYTMKWKFTLLQDRYKTYRKNII